MFDFTKAMDNLIRHISANCRSFRHVQPDKLALAYIQTRSPGVHGVYASVQPLRFKDGEQTTVHRGKTYTMPEVTHEGREILYIIYFALPRFLNLDYDAKLLTVFHELYHINPKFNGDIRRFRGRTYAHGHSRKAYNERMKALIEQYTALPESAEHTAFLRKNFNELHKEHGGVVGTRIRSPKPKLLKK